ncbi:SH2 domain-containing protein 7-like [Archocentrus centrarchus]|uniref:SH2 domain-containing protein 7-like n=1 Tax=Archocentrus centrarchus TaxID=63155 RepID=UPI0011E9CC4D|nr:SH2 domain-containing protein 7-like [Archocentrus centrarchus]XP_030580974.1 SH2 domain-containing protein 7-like [Archocentrus centrarchus]
MEKKSSVELNMEPQEGGLKELVLRWFTETQTPLIQHNGNFPDWFQGLATRKDAEDLLRDKTMGSFLIRLSDKAIGYILSYKGNDRCRHFVITQNQDGYFVISGDCQTYNSLTELIEHYKVSPIQPFGEYLTSSCKEADTNDLYDVVNYNTTKKSAVSVQALRTLWDQKGHHHSHTSANQRIQQQHYPPAVQPPTLPSKSRKLTGTVSVDAMSLSEGPPPVPKGGIPLGFSLSGSLSDTASHPNKSQMDSYRPEGHMANTNLALMSNKDSFNTTDTIYPGDLFPGITTSQLTQVESRSKSLPELDNSSSEEEYSSQLSSSSLTSSTPVKRVTCQTYSLHVHRESLRLSSSKPEEHSDDLEILRSNPLYQTSAGPERSSPQQGDGMYAAVPQATPPAKLPDNTYEQLPGEATTVQGNTYETLEDIKTKKSKSTWSKSNMKWKKFLPDHKKK